ncbi:hypothetical protein HY837_05045 [archaeon]|nr:hypothetical protein [archaeon]
MNSQEDILPRVDITVGPDKINENDIVEVSLNAIVPESFAAKKEDNPKINYVVMTHGFKYDSFEENEEANTDNNATAVLRRTIALPGYSLEDIVSQRTHKLKIERAPQVADVTVIIFSNGSHYCGSLNVIYIRKKDGTYSKN